MSLFSSFRKPAWQSSRVDRRLSALSDSRDPDLLAALPRLAIEDEAPEVRQQALRRCDDPALYARAMRRDASGELRAWARRHWLAAIKADRFQPADEELSELTPEEKENLVRTVASAPLRARLLAGIERTGFLAERALADPDADIRFGLIERIDQAGVLDRIADKARKQDKQLARRARERGEAMRRATGDPDAQARRAEAVCVALERLLRVATDVGSRRDALAEQQRLWDTLSTESIPTGLHARYRGAFEVLQAQLDPARRTLAVEPAGPDPEGSEIQTGTDVADADSMPPPSADEIAAQVRLQTELAIHAEQLARDQTLAEQRRASEAEARQLNAQRLQTLESAIEAGDLARARATIASIDLPSLPVSARRQWQALQPRLQELQDWERWAGNKVRARLCAEVEALPGRGLHPDALANRLRALQQEWRQLDEQEGRADNPVPSGLDTRFRVACGRAMKPARGFFEKRDALRDEQKRQVEAFLQQAYMQIAEDAAEVDTELLIATQRQAAAHLRETGKLASGDRKAIAARLRDLLDAIRPRVEGRFADIEAERDRLISAAGQLMGTTDGRLAGAEARNLMQRWKAIGKGRPGRDQQQWKAFRTALDNVFAGLDAHRRQAESEQRDQLLAAEALVGELESLIASSDEDPAAAQSSLRSLRERWQQLGHRDRSLGGRYDNALTRHRLAMQRQERDKQRQDWLALIGFSPATSPAISDPDALAQVQSLLFEAEASAGLEGPEAERDARRRWQLRRLQQHLSGDRPGSGGSAFAGLLERWGALSGLSDEDRQRYARRLERVAERLAGQTSATPDA